MAVYYVIIDGDLGGKLIGIQCKIDWGDGE